MRHGHTIVNNNLANHKKHGKVGYMSKRKLLTTPEIERVADRLGVNVSTVINWRYRGIPANWKSAISKASRGRIKPEDFPQVEKRRR